VGLPDALPELICPYHTTGQIGVTTV